MSDSELTPKYEFISINPLDERQRQLHPNVVFEYASNSAADMLAVNVAIDVLQQSGLELIGDRRFDEETLTDYVVIRAAEMERHRLSAVGAIAQGATGIARRSVDGVEDTRAMTETAINQVIKNSELYEEFQSYYGGLGWHSDQEKFVRALFEHGTTYDKELLSQKLDGNHVRQLIEELQIEVKREDWRTWYAKTTDQLFDEFPQVDYRKLDDQDFADSPDGRSLTEAYRNICGSIKADQYRQYPPEINNSGVVATRPVLPLTHFPLIESLMTDELSMMKPEAKYSFGRGDVMDIALNSDSLSAQQAIVDTATTRLPVEQRYVYDGPDEFVHKFRVIRKLTHAFETTVDPERRAKLKRMVLDVLNTYTGNGDMANEIRAEYTEEERLGHGYSRSVDELKSIVKSILVIGLASSDANEFITRAFPEYETGLVLNTDPLALGHNDQVTVLLDALGKVDEQSHADVFGRLGMKIFRNNAIATEFQRIAEIKIGAANSYHQPGVSLARKALRQFGLSLGDNKSQEELDAIASLESLTAHADEQFDLAQELVNTLIIDFLSQMVDKGEDLSDSGENNNLFRELLERISYGDLFTIKELPAEYHLLMALGQRQDIADNLKAAIVWKLGNKTDFVSDALMRLFPTAVVDGHKVLLGELGSLQLPSQNTIHGLGALATMARRPKIFQYATDEQLMLLDQYRTEMTQIGDRYLTASLPGDVDNGDRDQARHLQRALSEMSHIAEQYEEFLYLEDVKRKPHMYYPWLLKAFVPFWQKMQWEVAPGNRPSREISALYNVLDDLVVNKLVRQNGDYPEAFDVFSDGNLDSLLIEGYERMVVPHDIKYVNTVYHDGLSFMLSAALMMPESVLQQFKDKYGDSSAIVKYLESNRARFSKSDIEE